MGLGQLIGGLIILDVVSNAVRDDNYHHNQNKKKDNPRQHQHTLFGGIRI